MSQVKVIKNPLIPYAIQIEEFQELIAEDSARNTVSEALTNEVFNYIKPGMERVCVILRADGLNYREIGWVLGERKTLIEAVIFKVRHRLAKLNNLTK